MSYAIRFFVCAGTASQDTPLGQTAELHMGRVRRLCRLPAGGRSHGPPASPGLEQYQKYFA